MSVLKWKSDVHFRNKTGLLLQLNFVYVLAPYNLQELNKNLDVLESQMIAGKLLLCAVLNTVFH